MLTENESRLVVYIERSVIQKTVKRTTEVGLIATDLGLSRSEVSEMVSDLVRREVLKCATEKWADHCYIVLPTTALYSHLKWCNPFGL